MSLSTTIFSQKDLDGFESIHPGYRAIADKVCEVTNNPEFAICALRLLLRAAEIKEEKENEQFRGLVSNWNR